MELVEEIIRETRGAIGYLDTEGLLDALITSIFADLLE
jgi:hypothetical protein